MWRKRAVFTAARTRRQRREQFKNQVNALIFVVLISLTAGGIFIYLNWQEVGDTLPVNCRNYPQYCVPFAGGAIPADDNPGTFDANETSDVDRDIQSEGAAGVVRGYTQVYINQNTPVNVPFIGDPDAPIHFLVISNFACSHCRGYHEGEMEDFIEDYVLEGKATFRLMMLPGLGGEYVETASQAAFCAGEQGALWEMVDELYRLAGSSGVESAFTMTQIKESAEAMLLDKDQLAQCITSNRYQATLQDYVNFVLAYQRDNEMERNIGTPTVMVSYVNEASTTDWRIVSRGYDNLANLTEQANAGQ